MPGRRSSIICPKCKEVGGYLKLEWIDGSIHLPNQETITDLSKAWNYAARVLLHIRGELILFPPQPSEDKFTQPYQDFKEFTGHTDEEIRKFEIRHLNSPVKNIKNRISYFRSKAKEPKEPYFPDGFTPREKGPDPIHIALPDDAGSISKTSVSFLYAAIVSLALSDLSLRVQRQLSKKENETLAHAVYTFFSLGARDARYSCSPSDMMKIMADVRDYGFGGAANKNSIVLTYCTKCSDIDEDIFIEMERSAQSPSGWKCRKCGSTKTRKRGFTAKHLRNIQPKVLEILTDLANDLPIYLHTRERYKYVIQTSPVAKEYLLERFRDYEDQASKGILAARKRLIIQHYDSKTKSKKRCSLKESRLVDIEINDDRYGVYKRCIQELINLFPKKISKVQLEELREKGGAILHEQLIRVFDRLREMLRDLGWPEQFLGDKIRQDIDSAILARLRT